MDDADPSGLCERLAADVARELADHPGKRWRCPSDLQTSVVSYAGVCRERCEPMGDISRRLGLVESTLARWLRAERKSLQAGFRQVSIVAAERVESADTRRLLKPRGYCVEGLDAQTLALVLRVVG